MERNHRSRDCPRRHETSAGRTHMGDSILRVLAAQFADRDAATRVLEQLRALYDLGPHDAETAPLGDNDDHDGLTLLAGHFDDAQLPHVKASIELAGGEIVADVDEGWTHPQRRPAPVGPGRSDGHSRKTSMREQVGARRTWLREQT